MYAGRHSARVSLSPLLRVVNIAEHQEIEATKTPLSMGIMGRGDKHSPLALIEAARLGKVHCAYQGTDTVDGIQVDVIETALDPTGVGSKRRWFLDVARGAVPIRVVRFSGDGTPDAETRSINVREVSNGGFVCEKSISVYRMAGQGRCSVWVITLTSIDMTEPPQDVFSIHLEPGFRVMNVRDARSQITVSSDEVFDLDQLPQWISRGDRQVAYWAAEEKRVGVSFVSPTHSGTKQVWWWIALGGAAITLIGVGMFLRRYASRQ
jgi:hypothetical protein